MMRAGARRAGREIHVLGRCARCGRVPDLYDVERHRVSLRVAGQPVIHDLAVCRSCRTDYAERPTWIESDALATDATNVIAAMAFTQRHGGISVDRVQRTARYFLGDAAVDALVPDLRTQRLAEEARIESWRTPGRERAAERFAAACDDDDDLPF